MGKKGKKSEPAAGRTLPRTIKRDSDRVRRPGGAGRAPRLCSRARCPRPRRSCRCGTRPAWRPLLWRRSARMQRTPRQRLQAGGGHWDTTAETDAPALFTDHSVSVADLLPTELRGQISCGSSQPSWRRFLLESGSRSRRGRSG